MRVLILTDSLSLPRSYSGGVVKWENIYPNLLRVEFPNIEFVHVGIGAATITDLLKQQNYYALVEPDLVILQCGIVDCSPRALGRLEQQIIKRFRLVRLFNPFINILRKYRAAKYTSPKLFEKSLVDLKSKFPDKPFISIGILPGNPDYEKLAPGVTRNIIDYNNILRKHTIFVDIYDFPAEGILSDHHHLSNIGHQIIFKKLESLIERLVKK